MQADSSLSYQRSPPTKDSPLITQVYVRNIIKAGTLKDRQEMYSSGIFDDQRPKGCLNRTDKTDYLETTVASRSLHPTDVKEELGAL